MKNSLKYDPNRDSWGCIIIVIAFAAFVACLWLIDHVYGHHG